MYIPENNRVSDMFTSRYCWSFTAPSGGGVSLNALAKIYILLITDVISIAKVNYFSARPSVDIMTCIK